MLVEPYIFLTLQNAKLCSIQMTAIAKFQPTSIIFSFWTCFTFSFSSWDRVLCKSRISLLWTPKRYRRIKSGKSEPHEGKRVINAQKLKIWLNIRRKIARLYLTRAFNLSTYMKFDLIMHFVGPGLAHHFSLTNVADSPWCLPFNRGYASCLPLGGVPCAPPLPALQPNHHFPANLLNLANAEQLSTAATTVATTTTMTTTAPTPGKFFVPDPPNFNTQTILKCFSLPLNTYSEFEFALEHTADLTFTQSRVVFLYLYLLIT